MKGRDLSPHNKLRGIIPHISMWGLVILLVVLCCSSSQAATWLDPSLKWRTIETPHFYIHFHNGLEEVAQQFAPVAEEVHDILVPVMKYRLDLKTSVVLIDTVDYGNGFTTVIPDPRVTLYLTDWSNNLNTSKFKAWLRFVFLHEYVHALHLDMVTPQLSIFRLIFGRLIFPNAIEPMFITEGLAVYMETKYSKGGRGTDPRWEMMMRMDVLEHDMKSIDQAGVRTVRWPLGHLSYLYGVNFLDYLSRTYGEEKLITLTHVYGDFLYSIGIDGAFVYLYGRNLNMLWNDWIDEMRKEYLAQKASLGKLTVPHLLTDTGYYNLKPKWSRDSRRIFYQQMNADEYSCLRELEVDSGKDRKLLEASVFSDNLSLDPPGRHLLFSKLDTYRNYYTYSDLYMLDLEKGGVLRLTEGLRARNADISADGSRIVFVRNSKGTNTLMLMGSDGSNPLSLCTYEANAQYFSPRFSPDGSRIAVAKWSPGGEQKIYLVDPESGFQEKLTLEGAGTTEANPCFSASGDYLFFDSDRTCIVNLYAFHLKSGRLFQVTNVLGGAMMPDASPNGRQLAYVSYSSRGYDIAVMDVDPVEWVEVRDAVTVAKPVSLVGDGSPDQYLKVRDYDPVPTLLPKFWMPLGYSNENGPQTYIYTQGFDVLGKHQYVAGLGYDFDAERPQYSLIYANDQFLPRLTLGAWDSAVAYSWDNDQLLWMRQKMEALSFSFYDNRVLYEWDRQAFTAGFEQTNITNLSSIESLSRKPDLGNVSGLFLAWHYLGTRSYAKSIAPEDGLDLFLRVTMNSPGLGSDYTNTIYYGRATGYFSAPLRHHVLSPSLYGFYSKGEQLEQSNFSWRYLYMRGYPTTRLSGNKGALLTAEYLFPIGYLEDGAMYGNLFFDRIYGTLFAEAGAASFGAVEDMQVKRSLGAEIVLDTIFLWGYYGMDVGLGYVKGLDEGGQEKFYFRIGGSLAELLWGELRRQEMDGL